MALVLHNAPSLFKKPPLLKNLAGAPTTSPLKTTILGYVIFSSVVPSIPNIVFLLLFIIIITYEYPLLALVCVSVQLKLWFTYRCDVVVIVVRQNITLHV